MRILHFIPFLGKGGAERVVVDLANEFTSQGHQVSIVTRSPVPSERGGRLLKENITVRYLGDQSCSTTRAYLRIVPWVMMNRIWLLSHDVIHCHLSMGSAFGATIQTLRGFLGRRTPAVIETYHAVGGAVTKFEKTVHAFALSRRDAVAFMAEDPYWSRFRSARPNGLFRTIPNGVSGSPAADRESCDRYRRERAQIPNGAFVLGSVGRLVFERRPDLLLEAFIRLTKLVRQDVHLLLAGEGSERARLEADALRHGVEHLVHLPGLILNPAEAFGITDLYLTMNVGSITGIAALEAAFAGLPIVAMQLDSSHRRNDADWIWASTDPEELAFHIKALLADSSSLKRLAQSQRTFARTHFSAQAMAAAYEEFYRDALRRIGVVSAKV